MYLFGGFGSIISHIHIPSASLAPIAYPTAALLDSLLGAGEGTTYNKAELRALLAMHGPPLPSSSSISSEYGKKEILEDIYHTDGACSPLRSEELVLLSGVLGLGDARVIDIMTPIEVCLHNIMTESWLILA
jgi:metal transporter CNNM